jgi:hypothetical protein
MPDPMKTVFGRLWPTRVLPGLNKVNTSTTNKLPLLGFVNPATITSGTGAAGIVLTAGADVMGLSGGNMTLTIAQGSGSLACASNGLDITITLATAGNHASAVVSAFNSQFPSAFCTAALISGSAGGTNVVAATVKNFTVSQRAP